MSEIFFEKLALADPELVIRIRDIEDFDPASWSPESAAELVDEAVWALSQSQDFGYAYTFGMVRLGPNVADEILALYRNTIHAAIQNGLTLAQLMAKHFFPVLFSGKRGLIDRFQRAVEIMLSKGTYTLKPPLEGLSRLLKNGQPGTAQAFLDLICCVFSKDISYNLSLKFSYLLPQSVCSFNVAKSEYQVLQLTRIVEVDLALAERFLHGLQNGLETLSESALDIFVSAGLQKYSQNVVLGRKFLGLTSQSALEKLEELQVTAFLSRIRGALERTTGIRVGHPVPVRPLSEVHTFLTEEDHRSCYVACDGKTIYLPDEISDFCRKSENEMLYKILVKLESTGLEFGTFDFDLDRLNALNADPLNFKREPGVTDFELFFNLFSHPQLAADLFNIFEQGRVRCHIEKKYAGLARSAYPLLQERAFENSANSNEHLLAPLYQAIALGMVLPKESRFAPLIEQCNNTLKQEVAVEVSALLTLQHFEVMITTVRQEQGLEYRPLHTLYGRKIQPALLQRAWAVHDRQACRVREKLIEKGVAVYLSDLRKQMVRKNGALSEEDLTRIIVNARKSVAPSECMPPVIDLKAFDLREVLETSKNSTSELDAGDENIRRFKEWDCRVSDYIQDHVRVVEKNIEGTNDEFYSLTLSGKAGLVHRMRKAFELLKPEGLMLLRQWIEGDDFDYRALIDFALDKRAGIMPSDRLYIKRVKQHRDVAVLLLVDVSRSTANCSAGTQDSVLSIQKEAIVLFCEALSVLGDDFAIAGFSGSGRLNVDYFRFKDFDEPLTHTVKARIGSIVSQRSTRMGAAIRRAAGDLESSAHKVRLMLILSDGFPNDVDYKGEYAVADTRTAILEARAKNIVVKAITVNMGADLRLNDLYGSAHHHVIEDVRDLPDQLLRMYGKLTRA